MKLGIYALVFKLLFVVSYISYIQTVNTEVDRYVAQACTDLMRSDGARLAGFVRVALVNCVQGCNGCLPPNVKQKAVLATYLDALDSAYDGCDMTGRGVSKADFYAKCGQVALELGRFDSPKISTPEDLDISFRYGRQDCSDVNSDVSDGNPGFFPDAKQSLNYVLEWCLKTFGLDNRECVAFMGAHTLGRAHPADSGFTNAWVDGPGERHLDVDYFRRLQNLNWQQYNAAAEGNIPRWQWSVGSNHTSLMLNTDLCLRYDIAVNSNGQCTIGNTDKLHCKLSEETKAFVEEYSTNNILWLNDFGQAFTKMIDTLHAAQTKPLVAVEGGAASIPTKMSISADLTFCNIKRIVG